MVGASGFVGSAVVDALRSAGHEVVALKAPRLPSAASRESAREFSAPLVAELQRAIEGCDAVVNAAGNPDASLTDEAALAAANGVLVGLLATVARMTEGCRFVHVSSAVVQGRARVLDDAPAEDGFSAYARSKVLGEELALELGPSETVAYRPPSVHAPDRRVTRMIARIARSPLSLVAAPGTQPTPQALIENVASAIAFLATVDQPPPRIVSHPSEDLTTAGLLELLGDRQPRRLPAHLARMGTGTLAVLGRFLPPLAANARRVEMILFGQEQARSWLSDAGWERPAGVEGWRALAAALQTRPEGRGTRT
ncbi:NAD-dependent epimerase/dehydratase family protein [Pedococcus sp. NPDC057267]|uniref:NAD-dependent epimerase/dehydratase family protein n=1 Tax=Pedococcus sp. NPDC057267 TaxID=3346077 RepID=UPI0036329C65